MGNNIVKKTNPDAICAVIDVDEFLVTDENRNIVSIIEDILNETGNKQLLVFNFDVEHDYKLEKNFIHNNTFKRWNYEDVDNHPIWKTRCKPIIISKYVDVISFVHRILPMDITHECRDYSKLRMLHFRIPNLSEKSFPGGNTDSIKFVEDCKINEILKK